MGSKDYWIRPRSAEDRAGRARERDRSDELGNFERRLEWFRLFHSDRSGWTSDHQVRQAVEHTLRLESMKPLLALDPGGGAPSRGVAAVTRRGGPQVRLRSAKNRAPRSSFGFVGEPVAVAFDERKLPEGVDVKVSLGRREARHVDPASIRVFRFDEETDAWVLVPRSGPSQDFSYVWVRAHRPGTYAAVGLPADPVLMLAVFLLHGLRPQLELARGARSTAKMLDALAAAIFAGGTAKTRGGSAAGAAGPEELDLPAGGLDLAGLRERFEGLELPERGLPEWDILDDICPPAWRWPGTGWPWPPFRWPPKLLWPPILWPFFPLEWTSIGPRNVNGRVKCLAIHPVTENVVYAGAANGGVWKTVNGGASWLPMMSQELSLAIGALAIAPSNPHILYAATGEDTPGWGPSWGGVGVYKSDDSGSTWTLLAPIASTRCTKVLVHPTDANVVYVAGNAGLHKTTDGGATWTNVRSDHVSDALLDPDDPYRLYAGVWGSGVYRSLDGGGSWTLLSSGIPTGAAADWIKLAMGRYGGSGTDYLLAKMGTDSGTVYRSTDGGTSWGQVATGVQPASYNEWTNVIAVDPHDHNRILAGGVGLSLATDGRTFANVGGTHSDHHSIVYSPEDSSVVYLATDGGVYKSSDGGATWAQRSYQLVATQLYSIGVSESTGFRVGGATQDQGIVQTTGSGDWVDTGAGNEGGIFVVDPNWAQNIYTTPWSGNLRRSTDGGATWTTIVGTIGATVHDLAVQPGDSNHLLCVAGSQVFTSTDQGATWTAAVDMGETATRVVFALSDPAVCYAGTAGGRVFRSTSGGAAGTWSEPYSAANRPPYGTIGAIAVGAADANRLFVGFAGFGVSHVWRSTDGGAHWTTASGSGAATLPDIPVNALVVHHLNSDVVYAATDIGLFRTQDGGVMWQSFNEGMPRAFVSGLVLRRSSRMLYAGTMGRGAYNRRVWFS